MKFDNFCKLPDEIKFKLFGETLLLVKDLESILQKKGIYHSLTFPEFMKHETEPKSQVDIFRKNTDNIKFMKYISTDLVNYIIKGQDSSFYKYLPPFTEEQEENFFKKNSNIFDINNIRKLPNLSEKIKLKFINNNVTSIYFMENPSEYLQKYAINKEPDCIRYLNNPIPEVQIHSVESDAKNIQYIKNPCEFAQIIAVTKDPTVIKYIKNPCESAQLIAIQKDVTTIKYNMLPTEKVQEYIYKESPNHLWQICKPTKETRKRYINYIKKKWKLI